MVSIIIEAAENFLKNQIKLSSKKVSKLSQMRTVIASIDVKMDDGSIKSVFLGYNENLIKEIVSVYLMEDEVDEQTLIDMALESTNMIVGSAKVLAEEAKKEHFMISTPVFVKIEDFNCDECSELSIIQTEKESLVIAIKE